MTSPVIGTPWKKLNAPVSEEALEGVDKYWRVANYLSIGQIYLRSNPLMKEPFTREDVKHRLVGHWGTTPGLNFLIGHINRFIADHGQNTVFIMGPGHGGPAGTSQSYLDGTYTETYPNITKDEAGLQKFFRQFSYPGGIPSHFAPETPGSIHEGGELGYALSHAYGAIMDNPSLFVPCIVGDGEAETGPLATSWHGNKFVNPITDGAVLPILHLNGFKIANPTIFSRMSHEEVECFFRGCGWEPCFVEGDDPMVMHQQMAAALDRVIREIKRIQREARKTGEAKRPRWPMIVLRTPKGWTGPKEVDGNPVEDCFRAHQVPISMGPDTEKHLPILEQWLRSYHPEELFDEEGRPVDLLRSFAPKGDRRMGANPHANGGKLLRELKRPDFRAYGIDVPSPGSVEAQDMLVMGGYVRDVMKLNLESRNFRIFAPDETASNRLHPVFEVTGRRFLDEQIPNVDEDLDPDGRVMDSMLSEHMCQGWLEGYLLSMPGAVTDYKLEWQWQRYLVGGRMFAAVCTPGPEHAAHAGRTMVILKCDPRLAEAFREQYPEVVPGFYSDKRNWNSVYLDGALPDDVLRDFCGMSYELVFQKLTKRAQREIMEQEEKRSS